MSRSEYAHFQSIKFGIKIVSTWAACFTSRRHAESQRESSEPRFYGLGASFAVFGLGVRVLGGRFSVSGLGWRWAGGRAGASSRSLRRERAEARYPVVVVADILVPDILSYFLGLKSTRLELF